MPPLALPPLAGSRNFELPMSNSASTRYSIRWRPRSEWAGDYPVFAGVADKARAAGPGGVFPSGNSELAAPVDADAGHVIVKEVLLLVVSEHDQDVQVGLVKGLAQPRDSLLVPLVTLAHLLGGYLFGDAVEVSPLQQTLKVGDNSVGADQFLVAAVILAPGQPTLGGGC